MRGSPCLPQSLSRARDCAGCCALAVIHVIVRHPRGNKTLRLPRPEDPPLDLEDDPSKDSQAASAPRSALAVPAVALDQRSEHILYSVSHSSLAESPG